MRRIAIAMAKGGVGKTTTAVNLAHGLAIQGQRVLLVDCDTQGQAAKFMGLNPPYGLYEFITGKDKKGEEVARKDTICQARKNLWVLAGGLGLVELKNWLGEQPRDTRQTILGKTLVPKPGTLDYLIFDCAPGWDVLSVNILMAVNEVLCPVALQIASLEGLKIFFTYLLSAQKLNRELQLKYVLPTMFDRRTRQSEVILKNLQQMFRRQICEPIRYNTRISEAPGQGRTIFEYPGSKIGSTDYYNLSKKVMTNDNP